MSEDKPGKKRGPARGGARGRGPTPKAPASDSRYREMMRHSPFSMMVFDPSGRLLEVNRAFEEMWGVSAADVAGYNPFEDEQSQAQGMVPLLRRAFAGETLVMPEAPYDAAQTVSRGHRRWIRTFAYPVKDDAGRVSEVVFMHEDVTARREAEEARVSHGEAMEAERRRLREMVGTVPGVVWEAWGRPDASAQRIDFVSDYVEQMLGYTKEEWLSTPNFWLTLVHPDDREQAARDAAEHYAKGGPGATRFRWVAKDGRVLHVESHSFVMLDGEGRPLGMRGVTLDVTDRRRAEESLRESESRYQLAAEAGRVGVWDLDLETHDLYLSPDLKALLGYADEELRNHLDDWCQLVHPDDKERTLAAAAAHAEGRTPRYVTEVRRRHKDGRYLWFLAQGSALRDAGGKARRLTGSDTDITERKRAEEERERLLGREREARAQAEEAGRLKDEFLATVSHELRTPLTAITGWAHLLENDDLDRETLRHAVAVIKRNAEQQRQLIGDILDVSRIITGKLNLEAGRVEVAPIVLAAVETVQPAAEAKGVRLLSDLGPGAEVTGDPNRLQQVVWNLLANAVKFTPAGGEVRVKVARLLTHVRVEVSDTGQGISQDFLPHVFDRFRQADGSTTRQHGGLGLGLSIVRHLVEQHGGSVRAHSAGEGLGATFTVELPLPVSAEETSGRAPAGSAANTQEAPGPLAQAAEAGYEVPPPLVGLRVLLVDDDGDSLELLSLTLGRAGAEVTAAASAEDALKALARARPDVIISDVGMPQMDGYELMRRVRSLGAEAGGQVPAVALTAYVSEADRALALDSGFQEHLAKPVEPAALVAAVVNLAARAGAGAGD